MFKEFLRVSFFCSNIFFTYLFVMIYGADTYWYTVLILIVIGTIIVKLFDWFILITCLGSVCTTLIILLNIGVTERVMDVSLFIVTMMLSVHMLMVHKSNAKKTLEITKHFADKGK